MNPAQATSPTPRARVLLAWPAQVLVLAIAAVLAYGRTLDVPFYLDDFSSIRENSLVYHWSGLVALREYAPMRVLTYATFALNYRWGGFDPLGYHLLNLAIHFLTAFAVYGFTRQALRAPQVETSVSPAASAGLPWFVALLFLLHPLQTGAVTYIVQRLASMAALFYVAALTAYLRARLSASTPARTLWSVACVLCGVLALFSKENAATLPGGLLLLEFIVLRPKPSAWPRVAGISAGAAILIWLLAAVSFGGNPFSLAGMGGVASQSREVSRGAYLATQMPVLWSYLRLFFWPAGLHLDHAVDLHDFGDAATWWALAGHLALVSFALLVARRRPLVSFGVLFYYLAHSVESSIIPIPELAFEHRTYLPNLGLCLACADLLGAALRGPVAARAAMPLAAIAVVALGSATWRRNEQWRDPIGFWRDNVRLAPTKARAWGNLGKSLVLAGRPEEGLRALEESLRLRSGAHEEDENAIYDAVNIAEALRRLGRADEGLAGVQRALDRPMKPAHRAALFLARGNLQLEQRRFAEAEVSYREALGHQPWNLTALANRASALAQMGRLADADSLYEQVLRVDPRDPAVRENRLQVLAARLVEMGDAHREAHRHAQADSAYRAALDVLGDLERLNPENPALQANSERIRGRLRSR